MRTSILLLLVLFCLSGVGQGEGFHQSIDSLKKLVIETKDDSIKARTYVKISYMYYRTDTDSSLLYATKAYQLAKLIGNQDLIGSSLNDLGRSYALKSQYNIALRYLNLALDHSNKENDGIAKTSTMISLANVYRRLNKHSLALDLDTTSLNILQDYLAKMGKVQSENNRSIEMNVLFLFNNIGVDYFNLKEYGEANEYFEKFDHYSVEKKFESYRYLYYQNMGKLSFAIEDYAKAAEFNRTAMESAMKKNDNSKICEIANRIAKNYLANGQLEDAKYYLDMAQLYADSVRSNDLNKELYKNFGDYYKTIGDFQQALSYREMYIHVTDSLFTEENNNLIAEYEVLFETAQKELAIQKMKSERELQDIQNRLQRIIIFSIGIIGVLLLLALINRVLTFRRERKNMQQEIELKNRELVNFALFLARKNESISKISVSLEQQKDDFKPENSHLINSAIKDLNYGLKNDSWEEFEQRFHIVHPGFYDNLVSKFPVLSQSDIKMCSLLRLNMSSKEIASIINITPPSVDVARSRLRKKLSLPTEENLSVFLTNF